MRERISAYFDAHRTGIVRDISALIALRSVAENRGAVVAALEWMLQRGAAFGMKTGVTSDKTAGYIEIGHGTEVVGVLVHVDVVGAGDIGKWGMHDPFTLVEEDGMLFGRGVVDDKGPAVLSLYALRFLLDSRVPLKKRIRLIVGTSEESEWTDMAQYRREFGSPDYGFSPDGDFPISNIEKGYCDAKLLFTGAYVSSIESLSAGDSPNTVPSRAAIRLRGQAEKVYTGRAVHSSVPWLGENAIVKLAADPGNAALPFARFIADFFASDHHGVRLGIDDGSDSCRGVYVSRTTAAPTVLRLTPEGVLLNVNIRTHVGSGRREIERALAAHSTRYGYACRIGDCSEPLMVPPDLPFLQAMKRLYKAYGYEGGFEVAEGASYAGTMNNCVCWGPVFAGECSCAHEENERILCESLLRAAKLYTEFLCVTAG